MACMFLNFSLHMANIIAGYIITSLYYSQSYLLSSCYVAIINGVIATYVVSVWLVVKKYMRLV